MPLHQIDSFLWFGMVRLGIAVVGLMMLLMLSVGCRKAEVVVYEVPSEFESDGTQHASGEELPLSVSAPAYGDADAPAVVRDLKWDVPTGWVVGPQATMRLQTLWLQDTPREEMEFSVSRFPGDVGGLFSNVNRWRMQMGLQPLSDTAQLDDSITLVKTESFEFVRVDLVSETEPAMQTTVAILELDGHSWFFRMTATVEVAASEMDAYESLLDSVRKREEY